MSFAVTVNVEEPHCSKFNSAFLFIFFLNSAAKEEKEKDKFLFLI